ncbi:Quiescin Q6 sulfhydryl oxidase [Perkinsus chesapeaki]|uniref:Sulfhydryl oxidase n=1 Tax=Perkinsus chesapeaki TaxID=330153 RepID=A0A7J6LYL4_PERCH|nr:Quiescin Q6 sulfhydryl oxidase [Perkinsus chesapeaki]
MYLQLPTAAVFMAATFYYRYSGLFPPSETKILDGNTTDVEKAEHLSDVTKVVVFYAHWCGHCQWMARDLIGHFDDITAGVSFYDKHGLPRIVAFDCASDTVSFCYHQGVPAYPEMVTYFDGKKFGGGSIFPHEGNVTYEMRTLDGMLAFAAALDMATFTVPNQTLASEKIDILQKTILPVVVAVHPDQDFRQNVSNFLKSITDAPKPIDRDAFMTLLNELAPSAMRKQPDIFWKHCENFNCGLWQLFHGLTLGVENGKSSYSSGETVMETIKSIVQNFFLCADCVEHFVAAYDACAADRCTMKHPDREHTGMWLWRFHNMVNNRTSHERGIVGKDTAWPTKDECKDCREYPCGGGNFTFNECAVMNFLQQSYTRPCSHPSPTSHSPTSSKQSSADTMISLNALIYVIITVVQFVVFRA